VGKQSKKKTRPKSHTNTIRKSPEGVQSISQRTQTKTDQEIFNLLWNLKKEGLKESTLEATGRRLRILSRHTDLGNPERVKEYIANLHRKDSYKKLLCISYSKYIGFLGLSWNKPKYNAKSELPYVATEETIDKIIQCAKKSRIPLFILIKKTGIRPIELHELEERSYNSDRGTISIPETKRGNPRIIKLDNKTLSIFNTYIAKYGFMFPDPTKLRRSWEYARSKAYEIYNDPTIKQIRLYDLRHFKATMEYYKTRDILHVKQLLGHKRIETTLIYTHLVIFESDEWTSAVGATLEECRQLIDNGFEFVCDFEGKKLFRKRK